MSEFVRFASQKVVHFSCGRRLRHLIKRILVKERLRQTASSVRYNTPPRVLRHIDVTDRNNVTRKDLRGNCFSFAAGSTGSRAGSVTAPGYFCCAHHARGPDKVCCTFLIVERCFCSVDRIPASHSRIERRSRALRYYKSSRDVIQQQPTLSRSIVRKCRVPTNRGVGARHA